MGRSARQLIWLTFTCVFSSCLAEVALRVELPPETTSFRHMATSAQPLSLYHSSPHQSTAVHFNSTVSLETTPMSHGTTVQTTEQRQVRAAPGQHTTAQAGAEVATTGTAPANTSAAGQATAQATHTVTPAARNTTTSPVSSTRVSTAMTAAATNASFKHTTANTQVTAAATTSTATTSTATTTQTVKPTTRSGKQTTATGNPTATAMTNTTTTAPATQTVRPTPTPQPSSIPTGTYTVSDGNRTCIKVVMGLQLIAQNAQKEQMEYVTVNPNTTQTSGSCGMVQSELNLTFSGGFVNFTFAKQAPSYSVSKIESRIPLSSEAMFYYAAINEKLFTTKLGNSFKCASRQTFTLEKDFQILFVHMQLQAFDIVGNQFGKEEECFPDRNSKAAPIAVGLSILGLFVIVFATFLISRRKPHRGYERI